MIQYKIEADVIDIRRDNPKPSDIFLVDTNVWYWMTYSRASLSERPPSAKQTTEYPKYANSALSANAKLFHSGLSFAEIACLIEKAEMEIYSAANGTLQKKEFRHNLPGERAKVLAEIKSVWGQINSLADTIPASFDQPTIAAILSNIHRASADVYDLFIFESIRNVGVIQVITDDGDYSTLNGLRVFTANANVIGAARSQGKLLVR